MIVYGSSLSPFVRKVLVVINEKGLAANHQPLQPHDRSPEFRACSPLGKIPGFADGSFKLADSSAICHYLERKHPSPAVFPAAAEDYGRMVWFDKFGDTVLFAANAKVFFNLVIRPKLFNQEPDMAVVDEALTKELPPLYDYLESQMGEPFLVGGTFSLADIAIVCPMVNLEIAGHPVDRVRWPALAAYVDRLKARPSFARIEMPKIS